VHKLKLKACLIHGYSLGAYSSEDLVGHTPLAALPLVI